MLAAGLLASAIMSFLVIVPSQTRFHLLAVCVIASAAVAAGGFYLHSIQQTDEPVAFGSMMVAFGFVWFTVVGVLAYLVGRSFARKWTRVGERIVLSFGLPTLLFGTVYVVGVTLSSLQVF